jgi:hypothetical protein
MAGAWARDNCQQSDFRARSDREGWQGVWAIAKASPLARQLLRRRRRDGRLMESARSLDYAVSLDGLPLSLWRSREEFVQ